VVELLHGTPGAPADWTRGGLADVTADAYAKAHHGYAPILVMPDINGSFTGDTECVNGTQGNAETYLTSDVRDGVTDAFGSLRRGRGWAVAGLSEGGTCALDLALRHPAMFAAAGDYSGDPAPTFDAGLARLYGGTAAQVAAAQRAHDGFALLRGWNGMRRPALSFAVGTADPRRFSEHALQQTATAHGFDATYSTVPGRHTFRVWRVALARSFAWLVAHLSRPLPGRVVLRHSA
jgi:S-formylglutathione hydrolase FrmB